MKLISTITKITAAILVLTIMYSPNILAQVIEVTPEFGSLNAAISANPGATFQLARDAYYILDATIENVDGAPINIVAAEGEGKKPIIVPGTSDGDAIRVFYLSGDINLKNIYISNINELGEKARKNMIYFNTSNIRAIFDGCVFDGDYQSAFRVQGDSCKIYVNNSIICNPTSPDDADEGIGFASRGAYQDSLVFTNTTFYIGTYRPYQAVQGYPNVLSFDHCTFAYWGGSAYPDAGGGGSIDGRKAIHFTFTNNLLVDVGFEGTWRDGVPEENILEKGQINLEDLPGEFAVTDDQRTVNISNNVYGMSPEIEAFQSARNIIPHKFLTDSSLTYINRFEKMVAEKNIEEYVKFTDGPDIQKIVDYAVDRFDNRPSVIMDIRQDRNGFGNIYDNPETFGEADDPFDFSYSKSLSSYTAAIGNWPVGDLNWFPEDYNAWLEDPTDVDEIAKLPVDFTLEQNYPNPFNPSTTIEYSLPATSKVTLEVFDILGSKVASLFNGKNQNAGSYKVNFDASQLSSGIYFYRLITSNAVISKKMMLLK